jgi:N-acetylglucosamine-6-sulfatase
MMTGLGSNKSSSVKVTCLVFGVLALGLLLTSSSTPLEAQETRKPNIIFILTNDLDAKSIPLSRMPNIRRYLINQGTTFENAFVTNALCCPSRATILRGQYSHNHGVLTNASPLGGFKKFKSLGREKSTVATWLHDGGYRTALIGKYLNGYHGPYVPPGWDEWYSIGAVPDDTYHTDWFARKAAGLIRRTEGERDPFFIYLATKAPHVPAEPAPRHADAFPGVKAPRPPSFNEENVSDKPRWVRELDLLGPTTIDYIDKLYRKRMQSMLAVDEMVKRLIQSLKDSGKLSNTYIVFTSDHGWSQGEHRRRAGKASSYEEDIRVPLVVRGPGVPEGKTREHMVLNNDLAPTFAQLGRVQAPNFVDGRSLVPLLRRDPPPPSNWRSRFLVEGYERGSTNRPPYKAARTQDYLWVEYANGERELYNLREDPYELQSRHKTAPDNLRRSLSTRLDGLRDCARQSCRNAEGF